MFRYLYQRLRHGSYLKNGHGIKKFAERMMGELTRKVTKKSATYREMDENLMVEKANLRLRQNELQENDMLDSGEFFSMRRRLRANTAILIVFVVASIFMNVLAVTTLIEGNTALYSFLRWFGAAALALVLTGGGLIITERLIESLMPTRTERTRRIQAPGAPMTVLWAVLLAGILLATYGFSSEFAGEFASAQGNGAFYLGFMALSLLLPIIAGAVRWDALRYIDVYKTTQTLREIESRLAQIDSILRQNEEYESNFYKVNSISYWDKVNAFKTHKDNYNESQGIVESLKGHFAQSYDAFQKEASKRYDADIRDVTSTSMRRLNRPGSEQAGRKLGQEGDGSGLMVPASAGESASSKDASQQRKAPSETNGERNVERAGKENYLQPQPVR